MRIGVLGDRRLINSITTHNDGAAGAIREAKERIRRENLMHQCVGRRAAAANNAANNTDKWLFDMRWRGHLVHGRWRLIWNHYGWSI